MAHLYLDPHICNGKVNTNGELQFKDKIIL